MDLSVIIVNYNVKYFLEQCLCSVMKACSGIQAEIFVIDNNSSDRSMPYLVPQFPGVIFKWNKENVGFAKANNSVMQEAKGEFILFLNPDTIVAEDSFEKCISFLRTAKDAGAAGVRMIDGTGRFLKESKRSFPSPSASFFKLTGIASVFPGSKLFAGYYAGHLNEMEDHEVDVLAGAFMMIKKNVLDKVGGFDKDYFMYGEDIDLSYRIQQAGFKNYYFSGTTILHFKGESTRKDSYNHIRRFYSAMVLFVKKHYRERKFTSFFMIWSIWFSRALASFILFFKTLLKGNNQRSRSSNTAVVAGQQRFDEMIHLMKHSANPLVIKGRIAVNGQDKAPVIGKLETVEKDLKVSGVNTLLFCEGELNYKTIIETIQRFQTKVDFLFHGNGCGSIVGSNNKNGQGTFIAKQ